MANQRISDETRAQVAKAWPLILEALAAGELVRDAIRPFSADVIRQWRLETPGAKEQWDAAREESADAFMDDAMHAAYNRGLDPAHARVRIDTLKWAARIRNPRLYGDKAQLDVNVKTVDLTRIISEANQRLAAAQAARLTGQVVEGEVIRAGAARLADLL